MLIIPARMRVLVVMVSALALAAGLLTLALLAKPAQAQAQPEHVAEHTPFTFEQDNPCTGEVILVEGRAHVVGHYTEDASGGQHFVLESHSQGRGVSTSGAKYTLSSGSPQTHNVKVDAAAEAFTWTDRVIFNRQGSDTPGDDFQGHFVFHATVNANGELTVVFERADFECR